MRTPVSPSDIDVSGKLVTGSRLHVPHVLSVGSKVISSASRVISTPVKGAKKGVGKLGKLGGGVAQHSSANPEVEASLQTDIQRASAQGVRSGVRGGKLVVRTSFRVGSSTARLLSKTGRVGSRAVKKTAKTAVSSVRLTTRVSAAVARGISRGVVKVVAAVTSLASAPVGLVIVGVTAVVGILMSLFSWLPGMSAAHESQQPVSTGVVDFLIQDDYPYKGRYGGWSPMNYAYGNCTDFVAWRVNRDAGVLSAPWKYANAQLTPLGGNGAQWGLPGNLPGWSTVSSPSPGDIISIPAGVALLGSTGGIYGHVAYIAQVDESGVVIENYGGGNYFLTSATLSQLRQYVAAGQAVIKHNPNSRVGGGAGDAKAYARSQVKDSREFECLTTLWQHESGWQVTADNPSSDAYGIPQALPGSKMASEGSDWKTNGVTQVKWGLKYISNRYGSPCQAWSFWQAHSPHWY